MSVLIGQIVRVDLIAQFDGDEDVINVFQLQNVSADLTDNQDVLDNLLEWATGLVTVLKSIITTLQFFQRIRVQNISTGELIGEINFAAPIQGTGSANVIPSQVAMVTVFKTGYPFVNLRKFWGVASLSQTDADGDVATGTLTVLVNTALYLMASQATTDTIWDYGYNSPKLGFFVLPNNATITNAFATQRRRREGVGS